MIFFYSFGCVQNILRRHYCLTDFVVKNKMLTAIEDSQNVSNVSSQFSHLLIKK